MIDYYFKNYFIYTYIIFNLLSLIYDLIFIKKNKVYIYYTINHSIIIVLSIN